MNDWQPVAAALAVQLTADGDLTSDWREAFERVPRHVFLPGRSLAEAYANEAVVVQQRPAGIVGGDSLELPTSSASQPAVVAAMLACLPDRPGMRVLEIGTGTGYNAALLCHRLGDAHVFSVDIDPQLVDAARDALAGLGHHPTLAAADGYLGLPASAAPASPTTATPSSIPPRSPTPTSTCGCSCTCTYPGCNWAPWTVTACRPLRLPPWGPMPRRP